MTTILSYFMHPPGTRWTPLRTSTYSTLRLSAQCLRWTRRLFRHRTRQIRLITNRTPYQRRWQQQLHRRHLRQLRQRRERRLDQRTERRLQHLRQPAANRYLRRQILVRWRHQQRERTRLRNLHQLMLPPSIHQLQHLHQLIQRSPQWI